MEGVKEQAGQIFISKETLETTIAI